MARISWSTLYLFKVELVSLAILAWAAVASAQSSPAPAAAPVAAPPGKHAVAPIALEKPLWKDLTPAQQRALEPLSGEWNKLEGLRKQKWLEIANRFASMKPDEQQRVHDRMRDWLRLTPDQRRQVRENFARTQKITPGQKSAQWEQYQQLPEEKKKQLADKAPKKQVVNPPTPTQSKAPVVAPIKAKPPGGALVPGAPGAPGSPPPAAPGAAVPGAGAPAAGQTGSIAAHLPNASNVVPGSMPPAAAPHATPTAGTSLTSQPASANVK